MQRRTGGERFGKLASGSPVPADPRGPLSVKGVLMISASFQLIERYELGGHSYSWRLKDGEIRFRASGRFAGLINRRIPADERQVHALAEAFSLLDVWAWRSDYDPSDVDMTALDGSSWSFAASFNDQSVDSAGDNAFPSFADASRTSLTRDRFDLLTSAIYTCFSIEHYIEQARRFASRPIDRDG